MTVSITSYGNICVDHHMITKYGIELSPEDALKMISEVAMNIEKAIKLKEQDGQC